MSTACDSLSSLALALEGADCFAAYTCRILFAPLTGLQVVSKPWVEGSTIVIDLRLNCNHSDLTIEQVFFVARTGSLVLTCLVYPTRSNASALDSD